ncbi:MAG: RNA polymerase sigma factor [Verrucomicrobiota bacterium]
MFSILPDPVQNLCARAQGGDIAAASELIALFYKKIFSYFRRQCASDEDAQDLTQKCFCKIWVSLKSFRGRSTFSTWIHGVAYHVYVDWRRRKNVADLKADEWWETCAAEAAGPFEAAAEKEASGQLYRLVQELDDDVQAVVHLHYYQGLSLRETAQALNIATSTVKYRLRNALKFLKAKIENESRVRPANIPGDTYERSPN